MSELSSLFSPVLGIIPPIFHSPLFWVLALLAFAVWQFIRNKLRMDVVALIVMTAFSLSGILSVQEVFAGLSDPNIILIALLFIVGEGLVRTGVAYQVSDWLMRASGASETKVLVLLMLSIAGLGSFMSSTGIVAIFIPVVLAICSGMNISPKRLMMPLSVAGLISGMMTLIATAPNLVVHSELVRAGFAGFSFFSFTPIGIVILLLGIVYMLFARRFLDNGENVEQTEKLTSMSQFIERYQLQGRAKMVLVQPESSFVGRSLNELKLRSEYQLNVVAIQRMKRLRRLTLTASGEENLQAKDILLLDIGINEEHFAALCDSFHLKPIALKGEYFSEHAKSVGMAELMLMPESDNVGKTVLELSFRSKYGLSIVGIKRGEELLQNNLLNQPLTASDTILVMGLWHNILMMEQKRKDFILLNTPEESQHAVPAASQAPYAIFSVLVMVGLMITGVVPNVIAALIGCLLLGKFHCVTMKSAYNSIHFPSIMLIVGMMPFSIALQKTGGIQLIVDNLLQLIGGLGTHGLLMSIFGITAVIGLFISNTATAILMMPIALAVAKQLGYSPVPFGMIVAIASSAAFMTPVSSPVNTMVLGPAGYKFFDFVKIGVPFTLLVMAVSVVLVPLLFPLA